ncbi:MAG: acyltransferase family protein [Acidobacteriota bacterium]
MTWRAALFQGHPIDEAALGGTNNFNLLRLFAAVLVLYSHSYYLLDRGQQEPVGAWSGWFDASVLGVSIFFFISGFLVCRSWDARRDPLSFLIARLLRIAPAYWCVLLAVALVLGPAMTTHALADYVRDADTWKYVVYGAVVHVQYLLPGVFEHALAPGVNGSLWTVRLEVALYLMLLIAGLLASSEAAGSVLADRHRWAGPAVRGLLLFVWLLLLVKVAFAGPGYYRLTGYFVFGATCYRLRALCILHPGWALLLAGAAIAFVGSWIGPVMIPMAVAYLVLTLALHPELRLPSGWLHRNDYSYGLYLYGFPVQQTLVAAGFSTPVAVLGWALPVTLCCAALSWHLVERRLLARKSAIIDRIRARWIVRG